MNLLHRVLPLRWLLTALPVVLAVVCTRGADFVGSEPCRRCHPDVWAKFTANPHFRTYAQHPDQAGTGCEGCHGPAGDHIQKPSKRTIFAFTNRTAEETTERCLTCHGNDLSRANIHRSDHSRGGVVCVSCHSIHHPAPQTTLLAREEPALCYGCHPTIQAQFSMPFKHRVNEGFMRCSDCHNPHGAFAPAWRMASRPRMVSQQLLNEEACLGCHVEKRGPFVFEHASVRVDGCETCHMPHGSTNPRMLKRPMVFTMCLECHNGSGAGRTGRGVPVPVSFHNLADPRFQNCTGCHVRIHGSNADPFFLR